MARITPRPVTDWPPTMQDALAAFRPATSDGTPSPSKKGRRDPGNLIGTFACYPELAKAYLTFNGHILFSSSLSARNRELLVLRVAVLSGCEYEWAQHVLLGANAGLTVEEIAWIVEGPERPEWDELDRSLLRAVDELLERTEVSDATWAQLAKHLDELQLMDLVFTVGAYETLAMAIRSFGVQPDIDLAPNLPGTTGSWDRVGAQRSEGNT
jgi:AhpD family alkylhydroperoxidase